MLNKNDRKEIAGKLKALFPKASDSGREQLLNLLINCCCIDLCSINNNADDIQFTGLTLSGNTLSLTLTINGTPTTQVVNLPTQISTTLVNNGDGTFTYTNESNVVTTIDVATLLVDAGISDGFVNNNDGTLTHAAIDGTVVTFDINDLLLTTTPLFTVNAGTTSVSTDASLGSQVITYGDILHFWSNGSLNFNVQAGSVVVGIDTEADIIPYTPTTLVSTNVGDALDELAADSHNPTTLTNTAAPFSWNVSTQAGNIPLTPTLTDNGDGTITYNPNNGAAPITIDTRENSTEVVTTAPITINGTLYSIGTSVQTVLTALTAASHLATTVDVTSNPALTVNLATQAIKLDLDVNGSYNNSGTTLVATSVQDAITELAATSHPLAILTNNAAPFSWNTTTQAGNIPVSPTLVNNGNGTITFTSGTGTAPVTIDVTENASEVLTTTPITINGTTYPANTAVETILSAISTYAGTTNLTYTPSATNGTIVSDTGTDAVIPSVTLTDAGLATPAMLTNSHVPVSSINSSITIVQSGVNSQTLKADITGIATATSGQVASTDGAGNIVWTTPSSGVTDLAYTPSATNGIVVSSTGTDATISAVDNTNAGLATPAMLLNSHVPATFNDSGTIDFTVSGTDNQTVTATLLGVSGATIGQVPQSDGAGNITWVTPTSATNLTYTASPTQGTVLSDTGTDAIIPSVTVTDAGLATPSLLANSHVPVTTTAGTVTITQSGTDNQTLKADITGIDTATIGQIPSTDGAGNVVWVAQTPSQNIYNSDGTLTGNRTVDQNGNSLIINTTYAGSGLETHIEQSNNIAGIGGEGVGFWTENTDGYLSALYASGGIAVNSSQNAANTQFSRTLNMAGIGYQFAGMSVSDGTTQNDFNVNTTDITVSQYPNTRDDSGITTPTNVLYTDASGKFLSAPVSSIVSADNGLYVTGGITKLGGQLIEDTVIVGELDKSITIAIADAALTEINKLQITNAGVNLKSEGAAETSEIILNDGELSLRGETILKVITNGTPTSPNGSVLTLIDNLTGEAEWQPAGGSSVTVTDSNTIDLTVTGSDITGSVKLDTANGGLTATTNGLLFNADGVNTYDNTTSGITATTVQDAIDEVAGSFWRLTGNAGTDGGTTNFVGTTDAQDLVLKTNNVEIARFGQQGNTTIGSDLTSIDALYISPLSSNPGDMAFQSGQATGIMSTAFGASSATAPGSMAWGVGYKNGISPIASGVSSTAWGEETSAVGRFSTCFGFQNIANAEQSTCFGQENTNNANYATVFGFQNTAEGYLSTIFGSANISDINGGNSTIWGTGNQVSNAHGTAWGQDNVASGISSTVFGKANRSEALYSLASGFNNVASGDNSVVFGAYNKSVSYAEMVLGHFSTFYIPISITTINTADRLLTVGNGTNALTTNNALTLWKDGRSMWNGDVAKTNTWIGVNGTNAQNFINVTTPTGALAAISTEHTTSGNYAVLGSNAGNSGLAINNTRQFAFTTTAGTTSTQLGATTTIGNYSSTGFLFGGGGVATSTVDVSGSFATNILSDNTAALTLTNIHRTIINTGAATTYTLPVASTCRGREYVIANHGTGTITFATAITVANGVTITTLSNVAGTNNITIQSDGTTWVKTSN